MPAYEAVIGLEVHAELLTQSKLFCESAAHFGGAPNTHVGPVSLGLPGTLPVLNREVLTLAVKAGLATHCRIPPVTKFDRKHYFYPDLPKGYQITQAEQPIAEAGWLDIQVGEEVRRIRLTRIHMEEDAGKLVHAGADRMSGSVYSLVDYNRAGVPLIEIVSEPDLRTPEEARLYFEELRGILMAIGVCDGKMQEGSMRCDANVSIRPVGSDVLGTRVELKNINSFRFLQKALEYEIQRQRVALETGETLIQETRLWDENRNRTIAMRSKEDAHDYRYFPDPDLIWYTLDPDWVQELADSLPELPAVRRARYQQELALGAEDAAILVANEDWGAFFDIFARTQAAHAPQVAKWLLGDVAGYLNEKSLTLAAVAETPRLLEMFTELANLVANGTLSSKLAKTVLLQMLETGDMPAEIVKAQGMQQISDSSALLLVIDGVLDQQPEQVAQFLEGKEKVIGFLVGQIMRQTKGQADPGLTQTLLREALERRRG